MKKSSPNAHTSESGLRAKQRSLRHDGHAVVRLFRTVEFTREFDYKAGRAKQ